MDIRRQRALESEDREEPPITRHEAQDGWHFCREFDFLVTTGEIFKDDECRICICGFDRRKVCHTPCSHFPDRDPESNPHGQSQ